MLNAAHLMKENTSPQLKKVQHTDAKALHERKLQPPTRERDSLTRGCEWINPDEAGNLVCVGGARLCARVAGCHTGPGTRQDSLKTWAPLRD